MFNFKIFKCEQLTYINLVLRCAVFSGICPNQLFRPYLNHIYETPLKLIALVCRMSFVPKYFKVQSKEKLKTENRLSTFVVIGVANTEIFMSFIKLLFYKQTGYSQQFNFLFFRGIFWAPIPVNRYEIRSGYGPDFTRIVQHKIFFGIKLYNSTMPE